MGINAEYMGDREEVMKQLATLLSGTLGVVLPDTSTPTECFAPDVDIDGSLGYSNVVRRISKGVYTAAKCQIHCQFWQKRGCEYFVWQEGDFSCTLYSSISGLEHDVDERKKWMGPANGCLQCHRPGWDYVTSTAPANNLNGKNAVYSVPTVYACAQICKFVDKCEFVSFNKESNTCRLQREGAEEGIKYSTKYQTATKACVSPECVLENRKYQNGWLTSYDLIGSGLTAGIPGVPNAGSCQRICQNVKDCEFWTYDTDDAECFLVKSSDYLEGSEDKISGSRSCI